MDVNQIQCWYEQHRVGIYRFALSILKNPAQAEDVLQETFLRLLTAERLRFAPGKEKAWLYRVARNLSFDLLRKQKKELPGNEPTASCSHLAFLELMAPLSEKEQEIVALKILGNLTHKEIASALRMTEHAVKKRYERAIRKLRTQQKEDATWKEH